FEHPMGQITSWQYGLVQGNVTQDEAVKIGKYLIRLNPTSHNNFGFVKQIKKTQVNEFHKINDNKDEINSCFKLAVKFGYLRPDLNPDYIKISSYLDILNCVISEQY